ncbi:putative glucose-6-phosphate 1-epimerase [Cucurbita maxima]|uniref:glucose-6-phosphate 1-epimerase n=1 Tax=Cucurbita maxima TaxID=3661 RepID=A0A6J1KYJ8_CUCMA|nr:putative glucose-6-phosphate 1-epimerase [Cucurbita maxima]
MKRTVGESSSSSSSSSPQATSSSSSQATSSSNVSAASAAAIANSPIGSVEFTTDSNGLEKVILRGPRRSSAEVLLYGGQVLSWKNKLGEELLFVSTKAVFAPPKPIRGGIPICFPQFLNNGMIERHGFVRTRFWRIDLDPPPLPTAAPCSSYIDLILDEQDRWTWPHKYEFRHRVALGYEGELRLTSRIRNIRPSGKPFSFTFAYLPYLFVSDISEVRVEGVETLNYLDHLQEKERITEQADAITFESEVDKVYVLTPTKIAILDHERKKTIELRKDGLLDAVVWNPWDKKAKAIEDLGNQDYKKMVCVGAAAIENYITLKPGEEWKGRMELNFVPSSYCSGQLDPQKALLGV